jgi:Protein of unknown function (DUF3987)
METGQIDTVWDRTLKNVSADDLAKLAEWRGYRREFCQWLVEQKLIGRSQGQWAFPNCNRAGILVSIHYRVSRREWKFYPLKQITHPLLIRPPILAQGVWIFESQWDAFAVMDRSEFDKNFDPVLIIITRGASNGKLVAKVDIPGDIPVYIWSQNDPSPIEEGSNGPVASEQWQKAIVETLRTLNGQRPITVLLPLPYKDWNDWTKRDRPTAEDIKKKLSESAPLPIAKECSIQIEVCSCADQEAETEIPPFPINSLPPILREMTGAAAESTNVHFNLPSIASLGMVSASVGKGVYLRSGPDQRMRANIYILAAAESGTGKTESVKPFFEPIGKFEFKLLSEFETNIRPRLESEKRRLSKKLDGLDQYFRKPTNSMPLEEFRAQVDEHEKITGRIYEIERQLFSPTVCSEDTTQEALALILARNREQLFIFSTDAAKAIANLMGRYNSLKQVDDNLYVKGYSGDPLRVHRVNGTDIFLKDPCLSLLWFLQPDLVEGLFAEKRLRLGGLLPRCLVCDTKSEPRVRSNNRPAIPPTVREAYCRLIEELNRVYRSAESEIGIAHSPEAGRRIEEFDAEVVSMRKNEYWDAGSFLARWPEQLWRLSLVLHLGLHGARAHEHPLELSTVENALVIVRWFGNEQLRFLSSQRLETLQKEAEGIRDLILTRYPVEGVTFRDLERNHNKSRRLIAKIFKDFPGMFELEEHKPPRGPSSFRLKVKRAQR